MNNEELLLKKTQELIIITAMSTLEMRNDSIPRCIYWLTLTTQLLPL